jgi:hypothetical protein
VITTATSSGPSPVFADERADQVGVRSGAVGAVCGHGLGQREVPGREHRGVVDQVPEQRRDG